MRRVFIVALFLFVASSLVSYAQLGSYNKQMREEFTRAWSGERFEDGRPRVPDSVLERLMETTAEEAWGVLRRHQFNNQFEGNWKQIVTVPGKRLVGRAVTAVFMPIRPDVNEVIRDNGKKENRSQSGGQNSWVIDTLKPGDVLVIDLFGKIDGGTFIGDNLATSIFSKSGTGVVVDGSVRDLSGIQEIKGFTGYVRDFHPSAIRDVMLMGINVPVRIGGVTVMPGDIVLGDPEGITFVPAQHAEELADVSEDIRLRDEWGHQMLREGKYTPGQIDSRWTPAMNEEFKKWEAEQKAKRQR